MTTIGVIGNRPIECDELAHFLSISGDLPFVFTRMAAEAAVTIAAREGNIEVTNEELQQSANDFRVQNGLLKAADVDGYIAARGWTIIDFETFLEQRILRTKLRDAMFPPQRVVTFYQENISDFRRLALSQILCQSSDIADEIFSQIRDGESEFSSAARRHSLEPVSALGGGFIGFYRISQMPKEIQGLLLSAKPGDLLGPIPAAKGYTILRVEAVQEPQLTDDIIMEIRERLFSEWLDGRIKELNPTLQVPAEEALAATA